MRRFLVAVIFSVFAVTALSTSSEAFLLGDETKGAKFDLGGEKDLKVRIRLQPRLDIGDLEINEAGTAYESESDFYFRRIRLEFYGHMTKKLTYALILRGDHWGETGMTDKIKLYQAYVNYKFADAFNLHFGRKKLPYSRVSLTSSSKQLILTRPRSTEAAKGVFKDYYQFMAMAHGGFADGVVRYALAVADGFVNGDTVMGGNKVQKASPVYVARVELSLPGWVEKKKKDSHLGKGRHLTLGASYGVQNGIEYQGSNSEEDRTLFNVDLSGHLGGLTGQIEYIEWTIDSSAAAIAETKPKGWYGQVGYFITGPDIEPVVRYEQYDQDSNSSDMTEKILTVGLNWYPKGHSAKVGVNWVQTEFERNASGWLANDDKKSEVQIMGQIYY